MKKIYLFAAMAAMLAACSSNDLTETRNVAQNQDTDAVTFGAYVGRGTVRAGYEGTLDNSQLGTNGFGVFGYYTDNELYSASSKPDFFYNQKVENSGAGWTYSPIKYWPNEFGSAAISEGQDKLTFFAYAPYVQVNTSTGIANKANPTDPDNGIIALTRNTTAGDPYVKFYASMDPDERVDLCWGVAKSDFTSSVDGANNNIIAGNPYIDVIKPTVGDKINFDFKHALASLNVQIDADVDVVSHGSGDLATETKIYVRSVTFDGFTTKGMLNLNASATEGPLWFDLAGINRLSSGTTTIYDGRRDGKEGQAGATASNETPLGLNSTIIQTEAGEAGVTNTAVNLFAGTAATDPIFVIPTEENLTITIVYDVETADGNLAGYLSDGTTHGSTVENKITKTIQVNSSNLTLEAGKAYTVSLHLGMTSVKFDASVTAWPAAQDAKVDLPINAPSASAVAASPAATSTVTIPASASNGVFAVSSLAEGASTTTITGITGATFTPATGAVVAADGILNVTYSIPENKTTENRTATLTVTENGGTKSAELTIKQLAAPLGLSITTEAKAGQTEIALGSTSEMTTGKWAAANVTVTRKRGGSTTTLTGSSTDYTVGETAPVSPATSYTGKITLTAAAQAGDVYTITIQSGDADAETVSYTVVKQSGTISFTPTSKTYTTAEAASAQTLAATNTGDGTVTYTIEANAGNTGSATVNASTGAVTFTTPTADDKYTVTATVADSDNFTYATKTATYTIEITTAP